MLAPWDWGEVALKIWAIPAMCGALFAMLSMPANAEQIPGSNRVVAGWQMGAYTGARGQFSHCAMSTPYKSGITMYFSISGDYSWRVGWSHPQWQLKKGQSVPIAVYVDGIGPHNLQAIAANSEMALAELPAKGAVFDLMRKGYNMKVYAEGQTYGFNLDGTYAALTEVLTCADRYSGRAPVQQAAPAPLAPRNAGSNQGGVVSPEQRLEATKVVANILAQGEMSNFRILTKKEIAELNNDYLSGSDVVWRAEGLVGTLRILANKRVTLEEVNATIIGDDAKGCKGKFASGSVADEKSKSVLRLFTACEEKGDAFEARYTVVPAGDGTHYLFTTIGKSERGNSASRVAKVESALRQAVYEVMKE
jgi:hypothetical protein